MSIKYFLILATIFVLGCQSINVEGNYDYVKGEGEKRVNSITISYTNKVSKIPFEVRGRAKHDPLHKDKPSYQETSIEFWFW